MPGNTIKINNSKRLEYYVGDSKMEGLMAYLERHGIKQNSPHDIKSIILCEKCIQPLEATGGESNKGQNGFTEHFFCKNCNLGIDVSISFFDNEDTECARTTTWLV